MKEDRRQNIRSSVALEKRVEEPWTIERVAKFIDLLGYREITLKSDTEPAIVAFRNRAAEMCKAGVTTHDAVNRYKESNGLIEYAVILTRGIIRSRNGNKSIELRGIPRMDAMEDLNAVCGRLCWRWKDAVPVQEIRDQGAIALVLDLAKAVDRVGLPVRVGLGDASEFSKEDLACAMRLLRTPAEGWVKVELLAPSHCVAGRTE